MIRIIRLQTKSELKLKRKKKKKDFGGVRVLP